MKKLRKHFLLGIIGTLMLVSVGLALTFGRDAFAIVIYPPPPPVSQPKLISLNPVTGPTIGGTLVTLSGTDFYLGTVNPTTVSFGGTYGTIKTISTTQITILTPAHLVGKVDVVISGNTGTSTLSSAYTYTVLSTNTDCGDEKDKDGHDDSDHNKDNNSKDSIKNSDQSKENPSKDNAKNSDQGKENSSKDSKDSNSGKCEHKDSGSEDHHDDNQNNNHQDSNKDRR